jgi:hypothetical protein
LARRHNTAGALVKPNSPPSPRVRTRAGRGEKAISFSRCAFCWRPEYCGTRFQKTRRHPDLRQTNPAWKTGSITIGNGAFRRVGKGATRRAHLLLRTAWASFCEAHPTKKENKRKRNAGRRVAGSKNPPSAPYGCGTAPAGAACAESAAHSPAGVPLRTRGSDRTPPLNSSTRFLGRDYVGAGVTRSRPSVSAAGCPADRS